jgi:LPS sulfotransferase NodH
MSEGHPLRQRPPCGNILLQKRIFDRQTQGIPRPMSALPPKFLICTTARSGSTLLSNYLTNTGLVGTVAEYFNPEIIRDGWDGKRPPAADRQAGKPIGLGAYIDFLGANHASPSGIWGAKLLYEDVDHLIGLKPVHNLFKGARVIYLRRSSKLTQAISYYLAEETGKWVHDDAGQKPIGAVPFNLQRIDALLVMLANQEAKWGSLFDYLKIWPMEIIYEGLCKDPRMVLEKVLRHIEVDAADFPIATRLERQTTSINDQFHARYLREKWGHGGTAATATYRGITFTAD